MANVKINKVECIALKNIPNTKHKAGDRFFAAKGYLRNLLRGNQQLAVTVAEYDPEIHGTIEELNENSFSQEFRDASKLVEAVSGLTIEFEREAHNDWRHLVNEITKEAIADKLLDEYNISVSPEKICLDTQGSLYDRKATIIRNSLENTGSFEAQVIISDEHKAIFYINVSIPKNTLNKINDCERTFKY